MHAAAAAAKSRQLCLTLCDPIDSSPLGSSVPGLLQARTLEWVAIKMDRELLLTMFSSVQFRLLSCVQLFATPWTAACQASLSITNSWSSLKLTSIKSVMPSSHLILCRPLLLLPLIPPSIRVFSNESTLRMKWPKYWSFSFSIIPSKEIPGLISFRMDWLDLLAVQGTLKSLLQHHGSKASILRRSAFFTVQLKISTNLKRKGNLTMDISGRHQLIKGSKWTTNSNGKNWDHVSPERMLRGGCSHFCYSPVKDPYMKSIIRKQQINPNFFSH